MTLDKNYKVPEPFTVLLNYPDGVTGVPVRGVAQLALGDKGDAYDTFEFDVEDEVFPALPVKKHGKLWHEGWDIPTRYVIDANGQCWMDNAHGHALCKVAQEALVHVAESEEGQNELRRVLGLEVPMPAWARTALRAGWKPPEGWTWQK